MNYGKDFSKKTLSQLSKKGITIVGTQAVPANEKDIYFSETAYKLAWEGKGFMRTHSQVLILAASSWNPETDLK